MANECPAYQDWTSCFNCPYTYCKWAEQEFDLNTPAGRARNAQAKVNVYTEKRRKAVADHDRIAIDRATERLKFWSHKLQEYEQEENR